MSRITRRQALTAATGAAAGLAITGAARASSGNGAHPAGGRAKRPADGPAPFDEVYLGRRIQGAPAHGGHGGHGAHGGHGGHQAPAGQGGHEGHGGYRVHIDGEELHVMSNADGTWISVVNHYEPHPTPLAVARAAVAELQGADLVPLDLV
ncbi:tyrosinase family oxidase copper chaperone [Streptomyces sp. AM8-1-1]|uniref:tyrosinase family oxidase copper chaperone n=1 Tax=Streptomyces sp. AM8-1-1 TaxID=3075825 RepID=UPI0028C37D54|nr:tyrosinase family oxidase copper chaperone [Streptomyces sp. AM8-1-1]WNO70980.1 tyrosinase family oxidase copper chaperone [Streptomyces sp. AM8-1-1]